MAVVPSPHAQALVDELLQQKNVQPIQTPHDPHGERIFETDAELHEFLDYTYATRRADLG